MDTSATLLHTNLENVSTPMPTARDFARRGARSALLPAECGTMGGEGGANKSVHVGKLLAKGVFRTLVADRLISPNGLWCAYYRSS